MLRLQQLDEEVQACMVGDTASMGMMAQLPLLLPADWRPASWRS